MTGSLDLKDKKIVITGAAGGLGRAFALAFAEAGAIVLAADIDLDGAKETADLISKNQGQAFAFALDVTDAKSVAALAKSAKETMGGVDVLVNNAAIYAGLERQSFEDIEEALWDKVMAVNVKGYWMMIKNLAPALRKSGNGKIINIASATVLSGSPMWLHYVTSKGAAIAMTRSLARELGDDNITVNAVAPGFTLTQASLDLMDNAAEYGVNRGAIKRAADAKDMVGAALFLASPHADFMTGQTMVVDGGKQFI